MEGICSIMKSTCKGVLDSITTETTDVDEFSTKNIVIQNVPSGAGYGSLVHYAQLIENAKFTRYDHGPYLNQKKYGQYEAPEYALDKIDMPIGIFYGKYDRLADPTDVNILKRMVEKNLVNFTEYPLGHLSFAIAKDMTWFSNDVVNLVAKYANNEQAVAAAPFLQ